MTLLNGFSFAMDSDASQKMLLKLQKSKLILCSVLDLEKNQEARGFKMATGGHVQYLQNLECSIARHIFNEPMLNFI